MTDGGWLQSQASPVSDPIHPKGWPLDSVSLSEI